MRLGTQLKYSEDQRSGAQSLAERLETKLADVEQQLFLLRRATQQSPQLAVKPEVVQLADSVRLEKEQERNEEARLWKDMKNTPRGAQFRDSPRSMRVSESGTPRQMHPVSSMRTMAGSFYPAPAGHAKVVERVKGHRLTKSGNRKKRTPPYFAPPTPDEEAAGREEPLPAALAPRAAADVDLSGLQLLSPKPVDKGSSRPFAGSSASGSGSGSGSEDEASVQDTDDDGDADDDASDDDEADEVEEEDDGQVRVRRSPTAVHDATLEAHPWGAGDDGSSEPRPRAGASAGEGDPAPRPDSARAAAHEWQVEAATMEQDSRAKRFHDKKGGFLLSPSPQVGGFWEDKENPKGGGQLKGSKVKTTGKPVHPKAGGIVPGAYGNEYMLNLLIAPGATAAPAVQIEYPKTETIEEKREQRRRSRAASVASEVDAGLDDG